MANQQIEDILHEEVNEPAAVTDVPTLESEISREIKKFNIADAAIAQLREQYGGLTISGIEDREGYKKVHSAWQIVRQKRIAVEKKHKEIKSDYLEITRAIDGEKNRLVSLISPLEEKLGAVLDKIDKAIEEEKGRTEREAQERLQGRVTTLIENGMKFNGQYYAIGETISIDAVTLKNFSDSDFTTLLDRVKAENEAAQLKIREEEEKRKKEREEFETQKFNQEAERIRLQEERDKMERERQEMIRERKAAREGILIDLGFLRLRTGVWFLVEEVKEKEHKEINVTEDQLNLDPSLWAIELEIIRNNVASLKDGAKKFQQQQEETRQRYERRRTALFNLGMKEENGTFWLNTFSFGDSNPYKFSDLQDLEEEAWNEAIKVISEKLEETKTQDQINKLRKLRVDFREPQLIKLGFKFQISTDGNGNHVFTRVPKYPELPIILVSLHKVENLSDEDWHLHLERVKMELADVETREKNEEEAQRQASISDAQKAREWVEQLKENIAIIPKFKNVSKVAADFWTFYKTLQTEISQFDLFLKPFENENSGLPKRGNNKRAGSTTGSGSRGKSGRN